MDGARCLTGEEGRVHPSHRSYVLVPSTAAIHQKYSCICRTKLWATPALPFLALLQERVVDQCVQLFTFNSKSKENCIFPLLYLQPRLLKPLLT